MINAKYHHMLIYYVEIHTDYLRSLGLSIDLALRKEYWINFARSW